MRQDPEGRMPVNDASPWGKSGNVWPILLCLLGLMGLILMLTGCSDRTLVANETAAHHYHYARYEHECTFLTPEQQKFKADVNEQLRQVQVATEVVKIGKLPPEEKKELKAQAKVVRSDKCSH